MSHESIKAGDLTAVIGDNAEFGAHRAGYNGIWSLTHARRPGSPFVPAVAGWNLEHIFDGHINGNNKVFFEPRNALMELRRLDASAIELHQPQTPTFHLESWSTFRLMPPDYVDFSFRCVARQH